MKHLLTDEELIHQYRSGQTSHCLEALYTRYVDKVYRRCLSMTKDPELAQDLTHDIFIRVFDKLHAFQQRSSFSTWLYSITHNCCSDQLRRAQKLNWVVFDERMGRQVSDTNETLSHEDLMQSRERALGRLSLHEQAFLRLKYEQGISMKELAGLYGLNEGVIKMRLKRTRDKVQQFVVV